MSAPVAVHAATVTLGLVATVLALGARRRLVAGAAVVTACAGATVWAAHVLWFEIDGLHHSQVLWLPAVGVTCGAVYVLARRMGERDWRPSPWLLGVVVGEPVLVVVGRVFLGEHAIIDVGHDRAFGPVFIAHTVYCFALLLLSVLSLNRRSRDRVTVVRLQAGVVQWGALGALVAEALRLQLTDVVAVVTLTVFVAAALFGPAHPWVPPSPERLLDDLGALVLVFDDDGALVEWNTPAGVLCSLRGTDPRPGQPVEEILGRRLPLADAQVVEVDVAGRTTRFSGYSHPVEAPDGSSDGHVVVLRRARKADDGQRRHPRRRALMVGLPAHDPETGLLTPASLLSTLPQEAGPAPGVASAEPPSGRHAVVAVVATPDEARVTGWAASLERWAEGRPEAVGLARWAPRRLAVVALTDDVASAEALAGGVRSWVDHLGEAGAGVVTGDGTRASVVRLLEQAEDLAVDRQTSQDG